MIGGLAELFSGTISMGLDAYLAAVTNKDHYMAEEKREREEVSAVPDEEKEEIYAIMRAFDLSREATKPMVEELVQNTDSWVRVSSLASGH